MKNSQLIDPQDNPEVGRDISFGRQILKRWYESCMLCHFYQPFGCGKCKQDVQDVEFTEIPRIAKVGAQSVPALPAPKKLYIGSGEDFDTALMAV